MEFIDQEFRWSELVLELVRHSNKTQFAQRNRFSPKEVSRWIKGEVRPQGHNVEQLLAECERLGINPNKFRGLKPVYDFRSTFEKNVNDGPQGLPSAVQYPVRIPCTFLGYELNSPIGVPASVLTLNSKWISRLAGLGYDALSAKTVRTRPVLPHPMPNCVYLEDLEEPLSPDEPIDAVRASTDPPKKIVSKISLANSFGMPSLGPEQWQQDLEASKNALGKGQILIASIVGTAPEKDGDLTKDLVADFARCAQLANEVGPHAIEANGSCPNVYGKEGSIFHDPDVAGRVCRKMRADLPGAKILLKIGYLPGSELERLFNATYKYVDGYTAINTVSAKINAAGQMDEPAFPGTKRATGGISGPSIRKLALQTVKNLRALASQKRPELVIIGVGGISAAEHVKDFQDAGADIVQICTAALLNPFVAIEIRKQLAKERTPLSHSRFLDKSGLHVTFQDANTAAGFEVSLLVAQKLEIPFETVYSVLQEKWQNNYMVDLARQDTASLPLRTRRESPTQDQVESWVRDELQKRR